MKHSVESIAGTKLPVFIGGEWCAPASGKYLDSFDPSTGEVWYQAADSGADDIIRR